MMDSTTSTPSPTGSRPIVGAVATVEDGATEKLGFWDRVATLGVKATVTIGLVASWIVMIFLGVAYPEKFVWLVIGSTVWLFGNGIFKFLKS